MGLASWILGPQLIGAVIFMIGLIQLYFPPKSINRFYGYRLPSAMKNQQTWDEANRYSAIYMIKCGLIMIVVGIVITILLIEIPMPVKIKMTLTVVSLMATGMLSAILSIVATEKHLEKTFDKKTE